MTAEFVRPANRNKRAGCRCGGEALEAAGTSKKGIDRLTDTDRSPSVGRRVGWRNRSALLLGKALIGATRLLKQGGTTLPGRAALKISPQLISFLSSQLTAGTIAITGTNGKTTTASLLAAIFAADGRRCLHNAAGSNLAWGIASTFIEAGNWRAELAEKRAVLEIDEGAFPALCKSLRPRTAVVTNIFRDQLDRFGGVEQVRAAIQKGVSALPPEALLILNADDPLVASIDGGPRKTLYFGLDLSPAAAAGLTPAEKPELPCPCCRQQLLYSRLYFAHLGRYRCPRCGFRRPEPGFRLRHFESIPGEGATITLSLGGRPRQAVLPLPGIYNLYNALAAAAAASACGLTGSAIEKALGRAVSPSGRMERRRLASRELLIALIKNPAGANQVLNTMIEELQDKRSHLLIAINDLPADGTDLSWLGETDFELLARSRARPESVTISGTGAATTFRRLEKAGFDLHRMAVEPALPRALQRALSAAAPGEKLIILPNYTAMRQVQRHLGRIAARLPQ